MPLFTPRERPFRLALGGAGLLLWAGCAAALPVVNPTEKPGDRPGEKLAAQPLGRPAANAPEKSTDKSADKAAEKVADKALEFPAEKFGDNIDAELAASVAGGHVARALQRVDALAVKDPQNVRLQAQRAMLLSLNKLDMQALRLLDSLAARRPDLAAPVHLTALIHLHSGDLELARTTAQRAARIDPGYAPALRTLGEVQARLARLAWDQAARADRGDVALRQKLATLGELLAPPGSPFAQPGAIVLLAPAAPGALPALAPAPLPAPTLAPAPSSGPVVTLAGAGSVPAGPRENSPGGLGPRAVLAPPAGVSIRDIAATTRDTTGTVTFTAVATGTGVPSGFLLVPQVAVDVPPTAPVPRGPGSAVVVAATPPVLPAAAPPASVAIASPAAPPSTPLVVPPAAGAASTAPVRTTGAVTTVALTRAPAVDDTASASASASAKAEVEAALQRWAAAWSRRDVPAYLAAYTSGFTGKAPNRGAWEAERRDRIASRTTIRVELSEVDIQVSGDRAQVRLRQRYESDAVRSDDRKRFELQREAGIWRIQREVAGN